MKNRFRIMMGLVVAFPFYCLIQVFSIFIGRERAVCFWGPVVTWIITVMAEIVLIPKVTSSLEFDDFATRMKRNINFLKPLYTVNVAH